MNKKLMLLILLMVTLIFTNSLQTSDAKQKELNDEFVELFFKQAKEKEVKDNEGAIVIDTLNNFSDFDSFTYNGIKVEKKAIIISIIDKDDVDISAFVKKVKIDKDLKTKVKIDKLESLLKKEKDKYEDIYILFEDLDLYTTNPSELINELPTEFISDPSDYNAMLDYSYNLVGYGYYEYFNTQYTIMGISAKYAQFYLEADSYYYTSEGCPSNNLEQTYIYLNLTCYVYDNIYTGNIKYEMDPGFTVYSHRTVTSFEYQSFNFLVESFTAPTATISVIVDYWGIEKMHITSDVIEIPFQITKEAHYNRNDHNKLYGEPIESIYPINDLIPNTFTEQDVNASYFHQLLPENSNNVKYTKIIEYYNLNTQIEARGSYEIVYDSNGNLVTDDLVTFSFNFGVWGTYLEPNNSYQIADSHWVLDVYPYLIWGNSQEDANNHSAFERFIWDKDCAKAGITTYEGKNLQHWDLIEMYSDQAVCSNDCIGNAFGTSIPDAVIDGNILFTDLGNPYFDYIPQKVFTIDYSNPNYNQNWIYYMRNTFDNSLHFTRVELHDTVNFGRVGTYTVSVRARDESGNTFDRSFSVIISSYGFE